MRASSWDRVCAELRGTPSTVVAVDPRDLGLSLSHDRPDQRSPAVLVHANPPERPRAVGGKPLLSGVRLVQGMRRARSTRTTHERACLYAKKKLCAPACALCAHQKHSKMARCATVSFMLGEVTAPKCFYQAKVFHELNRPKIELLQDVFAL